MLKLLTLFIIFTASLYASDKVEIYATTMNSKENIVEASGGVNVIYREYFLSADSAIYDRKTGDLELFDNIRVNHGSSYKILGSYAKLNIAKKERLFKPFYMLDKNSKVWMSASEGKTKDDDIAIKSGTMSGCNPNDPFWEMEFSSSDYNANTKWLNLYNTRLYIYDIPVFYTPYFGYSLDTKRRTGLLMPALGLSDVEGFYYEQPIYIAEYDSWDLEISPQIRTNRGEGIYSTFRFVDSATSRGEFKLGYFQEKDDYFKEQQLQNSSHYGFNFKYDNNDFINQWLGVDLEGQSGIYVDINQMNDVDYINLSSNENIDQSTATQVLSRINTFYNTDDNYIGAYFKYYLDLTQPSNDNTLQKLPTLQYHHYLDAFLEDHLLYFLDIQSNNIQRNINKRVVQTDVNLPITLQTNLFEELLNLSYKANLYGQYSNFGGEEETPIAGFEYNDGYFTRNYHTLAASTQLTKAFENITHVIGFGARYTKGGSESRNGYYQDVEGYCSDLENKQLFPVEYNSKCEFYNITDIEEQAQFDFTQYIYDSSASQILYHRLAQTISYGNDLNKYGELENELDYKVTDAISYYNNMFFNFEESLFSKIYNKISLNDYGLNIGLSHLYKEDISKALNDPFRNTSYLTSSARYTYDKHYSFNAMYNYDMELELKKSMEVGFMYKKRCWDFGIRYVENNRPVLTQSGDSSVYDKYIYLTVILKPLMQADTGSSNISYKLPE